MAYAGLQWVKATIPINALPAETQINFSSDALLATIGVTMLTTILCGIAPALRAARGNLQARLTGTGKGVGLQSGHGRLRSLLVAVQVTLAIVLLVAAGLMMRTLVALERIDLGMNPANILTGRFAFPVNQRQTPEELRQFVQHVVERISAQPGVVAASTAMVAPLQRGPAHQ